MVAPDRAARLFTEYHQMLVRFLIRQTGDRDTAEEIAQETFVRALAQPEIQSERSWIFAVAMNLVRDDARKQMRRARRLERMKAEANESAEPDVTHIEREESRAEARKALDELSQRDRDALLMREEGLEYGEIAAALEISVGSVGTTLSRARRRLMEAYERGAGGVTQ